MFICLIVILMAWFVEMPLWLSILTTILASITAIFELVKFCIDVSIENY